METKQKIALDFTVFRVQNVYAIENDVDSRHIVVAMSDNGKPYQIPDAATIYLKISKPDGFVYINEKDTEHLFRNTDGTVSIILSEQTCSVPGKCEAELQVLENGEILTSQKFNIIIRTSVVSDDEIASHIESNVLQEINNHLETKATTTTEGHVKLTDSITSSSTSTAATPNSVKMVNDKIEKMRADIITHEQIDKLFLD